MLWTKYFTHEVISQALFTLERLSIQTKWTTELTSPCLFSVWALQNTTNYNYQKFQQALCGAWGLITLLPVHQHCFAPLSVAGWLLLSTCFMPSPVRDNGFSSLYLLSSSTITCPMYNDGLALPQAGPQVYTVHRMGRCRVCAGCSVTPCKLKNVYPRL